eukprot:TRINITY_DN27002_c0_g1_i1.p1 TRINITY_DN27002_c0_g1~~TRINITY_DN27002_c0_g1_i1.p1  ORF type:complete len:348 (+),score=36.29 TRINITY_DN27002_c0_g1_i1:186-1229(+)
MTSILHATSTQHALIHGAAVGHPFLLRRSGSPCTLPETRRARIAVGNSTSRQTFGLCSCGWSVCSILGLACSAVLPLKHSIGQGVHKRGRPRRSFAARFSGGPDAGAQHSGLNAGGPGLSHWKLHLYDHCPFCTRVELALGWLNLPYNRQVYGYADIEGPTQLMGKKCLPVLEWKDSAEHVNLLGESRDIVDFLDASFGIAGDGQRLLPERRRKDIKKWRGRFKRFANALVRPRIVQMPIGDFATAEDIRYQKRKYEQQGFNYEKALAQTGELLPQMNKVLADFDPLLLGGDVSLNKEGLGWDDIYLLAQIRRLTCVAGLRWPRLTRRYLENAHDRAGVNLYFQHAF